MAMSMATRRNWLQINGHLKKSLFRSPFVLCCTMTRTSALRLVMLLAETLEVVICTRKLQDLSDVMPYLVLGWPSVGIPFEFK